MQETKRTQKIDPKVIAAVIATGLMSFCGVIVETSMNVTFPTLMKQFNVTTSTVQWMTTGYLLTVAIIVPLSATFKRRFKTKSLFITANLLFMAGVLIDATAPAFTLLLFGRIVQGFGTGIALPLMFNIILEQVPISKRGLMMGVGTLITAKGCPSHWANLWRHRCQLPWLALCLHHFVAVINHLTGYRNHDD